MARRLADSKAIREALSRSSRLLLIGAGFIGAEVAASARRLGKDVLMVEALEVPLQRALGRDVGEVYAAIHKSEGVDVRTGTTVQEWHASGDRVTGVSLSDGSRHEVDLARRSFTLSFAASADPQLWGLVPMVLTSAAFENSNASTLARLVHATDSAAVQLEGNVSKGWGRATVADAYDDAAAAHWRYAGIARPEWWTWQEERTFRLIGEAVAYERAKRCVAGN